MFDYNHAKTELKKAINKHGLWQSLSKAQGCHVKTLRKWFSPDSQEIPFSFIALCRDIPQLRSVMLAMSRHWMDSLKYDHDKPVWFIQHRYQFKADVQESASRTMILLQEFYAAMKSLPNHRFWLKESGDDQLAIIDIRCPYKPVPISPIDSDTYGWRYMAPTDEIELYSDMNYNELILFIFEKECGREMWQWAEELQKYSTLLLPSRTVRQAFNYCNQNRNTI